MTAVMHGERGMFQALRRVMLVTLCFAVVAIGSPTAEAERSDRPVRLDRWIEREIDAVVSSVEPGANLSPVRERVLDVFDVGVSFVDERRLEWLRPAERARRLFAAVARSNMDEPAAFIVQLREHPSFMDELAFLVGEADAEAEAFGMARTLMNVHGDRVDEFAALAAAVCVVHDGRFEYRVNENMTVAPAPDDLFDYFASAASSLRYDPRELPAELLVFVVDVTADVADLKWALDRYHVRADIGERFFEIEYDYDHFRKGTEKKVTASGDYCLPNIKRFGGVCADQAFFAKTVGKAFGVPTAYVRAKGAGVAHAWVGNLEVRGRDATWDLDAGRYEEYQNLRGVVRHPQTRAFISDNELSLVAGMAIERLDARRTAAIGLGAAERIATLREADGELPSSPPEGVRLRSDGGRDVSLKTELELLEAGLRAAPANAAGWAHVVELAAAGELAADEMRRWFGVLDRLAGREYPYFAAESLLAMAEGLPDAEAKHRACEWAFDRYRRRADLASAIRLYQGEVWKAAGDERKAWIAFNDVLERYANTSPYVLDALQASEELLRRRGMISDIVTMYEKAFAAIDEPRSSAGGAFRAQSNWYRVGNRLAEAYREAGRTSDANAVMRRIDG